MILLNGLKCWLIFLVNVLGSIDTSQPVSIRNNTLVFLSTANCKSCGKSAGSTDVRMSGSCAGCLDCMAFVFTLDFEKDGTERFTLAVLDEAVGTARFLFCFMICLLGERFFVRRLGAVWGVVIGGFLHPSS